MKLRSCLVYLVALVGLTESMFGQATASQSQTLGAIALDNLNPGVVVEDVRESSAADKARKFGCVFQPPLLESYLEARELAKAGLGKEIQSEGLIGLTRRFMCAGASLVVASLWKTDDGATARVDGAFLQGNGAGGHTARRSFTTSRVQMWKQKRWVDPYYWAGLQIQANWRYLPSKQAERFRQA